MNAKIFNQRTREYWLQEQNEKAEWVSDANEGKQLSTLPLKHKTSISEPARHFIKEQTWPNRDGEVDEEANVIIEPTNTEFEFNNASGKKQSTKIDIDTTVILPYDQFSYQNYYNACMAPYYYGHIYPIQGGPVYPGYHPYFQP